MVVDSSAIVGVLLNQENAGRLAQAIEADAQRLLSAANLLEASIIIDSRKGEAGGRELVKQFRQMVPDRLSHRPTGPACQPARGQAPAGAYGWHGSRPAPG
ncbi:MAG TPA: type II toxin-antitoxin system VapC family toxin [Stellaceae bacterium]|jgi:uncharacterized protein with PIN domain